MSKAIVMPFSSVLSSLICALIETPVTDCARKGMLALIKPAIAPNATLNQ